MLKLTRKERQACDLLIQGCDNREIALELGVAQRTVKAYFAGAFKANGITGGVLRVKLAVLYYRERLAEDAGASGTNRFEPGDAARADGHRPLPALEKISEDRA
jgi:Bacterial regulatory proteins, luxR family